MAAAQCGEKLLEIESGFPVRLATPMIVRAVTDSVNRCEQIFFAAAYSYFGYAESHPDRALIGGCIEFGNR